MLHRVSLRITSQSTMQIASAFVVKQVHDLWNLINCLSFDCTVKRRQLMGQTVYKSDVGYRSILLYLFQLNYN